MQLYKTNYVFSPILPLVKKYSYTLLIFCACHCISQFIWNTVLRVFKFISIFNQGQPMAFKYILNYVVLILKIVNH